MTKTLCQSLSLLAFVCLLIGCEASGPTFKAIPLNDQSAAIYVYRHNAYKGSGITLNIEVDGEKIGGLKPNGYLYHVVTPGTHIVRCNTESESTVEVIAEPNQAYYIEGEVVMGFWMGRPKLVMVDPKLGRANIGGKKYSGKTPKSPPATQNE